MRRLLAFTALVLLCVLAHNNLVRAESGGITVSPALQEITLEAEQTEHTFTVKVTNHTGMQQDIKLSAIDFGALDESGGVAFLGSSPDVWQQKYGLQQWLIFEKDTITIDPNTTGEVNVTIINRESLAPGGHYGAVLATPIPRDSDVSGTKVEIQQSASALILLKKLGGERYEMSLDRLEIEPGLKGQPSKVLLRFHNSGNMHVIPRGYVLIKDSFGRTVSEGTINTVSGSILPESFRKYSVDMRQLTSWTAPGRYTVEAYYRYDGKEDFEFYQQSFGIYIIAIYAAIVLLLLALGLYRFKKPLRRSLKSLKKTIRKLTNKKSVDNSGR